MRILYKELAVIFLVLVVCLLIGGLIAFIAVQNPTPLVHLNLFAWRTPDLQLGVWLVLAFLCGAIILYLVTVPCALSDRHKIKTLRKRVLALEEQMTASGQKDSPSTEQTPENSLSSVDTAPMMPMPGVINTPQPDGRIPSAPLSPLQNFHQ